MSDLLFGILVGSMVVVLLGGLFMAFVLGRRRNHARSKQTIPPRKRRIPGVGATIPKGGIAQTRFAISSSPPDPADRQ